MKGYMFYMIYNMNDIPLYCCNLLELCNLSKLRTFEINYMFKKTLSDYIITSIDNELCKVYRYIDD